MANFEKIKSITILFETGERIYISSKKIKTILTVIECLSDINEEE